MIRPLFAAAALVALGSTIALPAQAATLTLPPQPRTLFMGDSYTQGVGDENLTNGAGYAPTVSADLGWVSTIDGKGGTGYVNPGRNNEGTFVDRINRRYYANRTVAYDLIVVQGSSNDQKYTSGELATALNKTLRTIQARYPHAKILMVGPTNPYGNPGADLLRVDGKLKQAASSAGVPFIDPLAERWFVSGDSARYANPINGHPNDAGYAVIAQRLEQDVRGLES